MNKEDKQNLLNEYISMTGKTSLTVAEETGYDPSTISFFKKGRKEIPDYFAWGLVQAVRLKRLQEKLCE